jgi:hypothetical protein
VPSWRTPSKQHFQLFLNVHIKLLIKRTGNASFAQTHCNFFVFKIGSALGREDVSGLRLSLRCCADLRVVLIYLPSLPVLSGPARLSHFWPGDLNVGTMISVAGATAVSLKTPQSLSAQFTPQSKYTIGQLTFSLSQCKQHNTVTYPSIDLYQRQ